MYYKSTSNPHHLPPVSVDTIGTTDQANHNYGLADFWNATIYGNLPAVSFIKFASANTGHPADSTVLAEQRYLVDTINALQALPVWNSTAVFITYDDSDGWYDHVMPPIVNYSNDPANDSLLGPTGMCGKPAPGAYRSLRLRNAPAVARDFAVRQAKLRGFVADRHDFHPAIHRGQLESGPDRRSVVRRAGRIASEHV
jgi:hypothetical protein